MSNAIRTLLSYLIFEVQLLVPDWRAVVNLSLRTWLSTLTVTYFNAFYLFYNGIRIYVYLGSLSQRLGGSSSSKTCSTKFS